MSRWHAAEVDEEQEQKFVSVVVMVRRIPAVVWRRTFRLHDRVDRLRNTK
jgi:hypothetical protein